MSLKNQLNLQYYTWYVLYLLLVVIFGYLLKDFGFIDPMSRLGQIVQYAVIFYVLASVPGALYGFKKHMATVAKIEDEKKREEAYLMAAAWRMLLIALGVIASIVAFYIMSGYRSMLFCAGIGLLAQFFCKPTDEKIRIEMNDVPEEERY